MCTPTIYSIDNKLYSKSSRSTQKNARTKEPSLFAEDEKKTRKPKAQKTPPSPPPTIEEVTAYFERQSAGRLADWQGSAQRFFDHFSSVGWMASNNRRIERWESRANLWILDDEGRQKQYSHATIQSDNKFSERRGTEPTAKSRKDFNGTL
jgi:hypothetical protein